MTKVYRYMLTQRPPGIGCFPVEGFLRSGVDIDGDNAKRFTIPSGPKKGRHAYELLYSRELTEQEIKSFELHRFWSKVDIGRTWERPFGKGKEVTKILSVDELGMAVRILTVVSSGERKQQAEEEIPFTSMARELEHMKEVTE